MSQVSWGFYIRQLTFLVGVAAAAVVLVIPAYIYNWGLIKEIVILGELLAVSATVMCVLFVTVDIGHPERVWHMLPGIGHSTFPIDSGLGCGGPQRVPDSQLRDRHLHPVLLVRMKHYRSANRLASGHPVDSDGDHIHTVTALQGRPRTPLLERRDLGSEVPGIGLLLGTRHPAGDLQILRKTALDEAIWKIAELMAYAMFINLYLQAVDIFKEFYSNTDHTLYARYMFFGLKGHNAVVPFAWASLAAGIIAFFLFLIPYTRRNPITLNLGCLLIYSAVSFGKGECLVIPRTHARHLG